MSLSVQNSMFVVQKSIRMYYFYLKLHEYLFVIVCQSLYFVSSSQYYIFYDKNTKNTNCPDGCVWK
jgi:hypothetical protein